MDRSIKKILLYSIWTVGLLFFSCEKDTPEQPKVRVATELEGAWSGRISDGSNYIQWTYRMSLDSIFVDTTEVEYYRGTFSVDTTVNPRTIDIHIGTSSKPEYIGKTFLGLYTISGNVVDITANEPGTPRPVSMDAAGPTISLIK